MRSLPIECVLLRTPGREAALEEGAHVREAFTLAARHARRADDEARVYCRHLQPCVAVRAHVSG